DQAHNVTFTPTDTAAYNILTHDVTVTVAYGSTGLQPDGSFVLFDGTSWAGGDITIQYEGSDNDEVVYFKAPIDISGYKHAILEYQDQWWWGWNGGHFIVNSGTKYTYWNTEYYVPDNIKEAEFYNLTLNFSDANSYTGPVDSDGAVPAGTELKGFCWQRDGSYNAAILQKITLIKDIPDVGDGTGIQPDGSLVLFNNGAWAAACGDVTEEQQASDMVKIFSTPIDVGGYKQAILELYDSPWFWGNLIGQFMIDGGGAYSYWGNGWNDDTNSVIPDYSYTENPLILTLSFSEATGGGAVDAGGAILAGIKFSEFSWKRNADYNTDIISKITLTK
ncbi:MAG: hypothetical protein FWF29_02030, partial [Treponema sp.]|nr:hypothetical protein [Treponema sp.]